MIVGSLRDHYLKLTTKPYVHFLFYLCTGYLLSIWAHHIALMATIQLNYEETALLTGNAKTNPRAIAVFRILQVNYLMIITYNNAKNISSL